MKETGIKVCTRCKKEKLTSQFYRDATRKDNLTCWCRDCMVSANNKQLEQLKIEVLTHYGNGKLSCVRCGFEDIRALTIDHIKGGGWKHRRSLGLSGNMFYRWLQRNSYPKGYQTLCMNCQLIKLLKEINKMTGRQG